LGRGRKTHLREPLICWKEKDERKKSRAAMEEGDEEKIYPLDKVWRLRKEGKKGGKGKD